MNDSAKAKLCSGQFLLSDMNYCGAGILPPNSSNLHLVDLKGPFVLQVDEIVNTSQPLRERYKNAAPGIKRCLKLSMTDGVRRVFGMEYRPIKDLEVLAPAGVKVAVCNVNVRHGLMMLVPENIVVLGGIVEELEAARQRLVNEINKPARGKGVVPSLATRTRLAAWPTYNDAAPGHVDRNPQMNTTPPLQTSVQGTGVRIPASGIRRTDFPTPSSRNYVEPNMSGAPQRQEQAEDPMPADMPTSSHLQQGLNFPGNNFEVPVSRSNTGLATLPRMQPMESLTIPQHVDEPTAEVMAPRGGTRREIPAVEDVNVLNSEDYDEPNLSTMDMDVEELSILDDLVQRFMLSRDKEVPFTYLASLSAKYAANDDETSVVRGKIKCFVTGVKEFQYKQRTTYELKLYVDDGSLISEILIDHNVVQNRIGYSPPEVTSALTSSESKRISEMKEIMKQFQLFLVNFEGTMILEMSNSSPIPVAVEMNQGCPASDAWLLLKRVKSFSSALLPNQSHLDPIELSP